MFDNSVLSDVNIRQISEGGKVREYHGHKPILGARSTIFFKAFAGNFKVAHTSIGSLSFTKDLQEATSNVIELHDDDPK